MKNIAYIGIGSNLGDRGANCKKAIGLLGELKETKVLAASSFYETEPVGRLKQGWFINAAVKLETTLPARELFTSLQRIEKQIGRQHSVKNAPRIIDLDLLFYNQEIINQAELRVPHPRLHSRRFVLTALNEIAAKKVHPELKLSTSQLLARLKDKKIVRKIGVK